MKHAQTFNPKHAHIFNPGILPGWARRCREVVKLCEINREFLRNVLCARDPRYKRILIQKAREICRKMGGE